MELEHTTVKELKLLDSAVREQPVEADITLPEYYPAVGRILKCFVSPSEEAVTCAEGRVSVAGAAAVRLLYADDDNRLHSYQTEAKYTKILQTDVRDEQAAVRVSQDVSTLNCRALGPKRVEVKANIAVKAELFGIRQTAVVSAAGEELPLLTERMDYCEPVCVHCRDFTVSDSVRCEAGGRRLRTVIAASAVPVVEKTEIIADKIMLRGKNSVAVICADEDGQIGSYELSVPFSEVLDCRGVGEDTVCSPLFFRCAAEAALPEDADNQFDVTVRNQLLLLATVRRELTFATDAYSLTGETECGFAELTPARAFSLTVEEQRVSAELEAFEEGGLSVRNAFVGDLVCAATNSSGGLVEGTLCFYALIADGDNRLSVLSKSVSFSHPAPDGSRCVSCAVSAKNEAGEMTSGGKVNVSCSLVFQMLTQSGERKRMLTEAKVKEDGCALRQERAVVYYAEKGETLWSIAKENRTFVGNIRAYNSLSADVLDADMRLVFPCF